MALFAVGPSTLSSSVRAAVDEGQNNQESKYILDLELLIGELCLFR